MATILLVEDDEASRDAYAAYLRHFGHEVIEARDGEACIELARRHRPDIALVDLSLPKLNGWTATRILKESPETADMPVIVLSAHDLPDQRQRAMDAGASAFLPKPCEPPRVLAAIDRHLQSGA